MGGERKIYSGFLILLKVLLFDNDVVTLALYQKPLTRAKKTSHIKPYNRKALGDGQAVNRGYTRKPAT